MKTFLILFASFLLTACQSPPFSETSLFSVIPENSTLTLNQTITIPAEKVAIYLQDGKIKNERDIDHYYPNCKFEIKTLLPDKQTVSKDVFTIRRLQRREDYTARKSMFASGPGFNLASAGASPQNYATLMYLSSETQPDVLRMICAHWVEPAWDDDHLTIQQIRKVMGDVFSLKLNR